MDYQAEVAWCPTPAGHSGQPSDSCGGTFKRIILNEAAAGKCKRKIVLFILNYFLVVRGVIKGEQLVAHAQSMDEFAEIDHKKFLSRLTVSRAYFYLSRKDVIEDHAEVLEARAVATYSGVSKFKQAFGTGTPFQLLVRHKLCCCQACLAREFDDCELQVS